MSLNRIRLCGPPRLRISAVKHLRRNKPQRAAENHSQICAILRGAMVKTILRDEWRFLTFRTVSAAVHTHWQAFLIFGLACTWLAGIGRYWDNPRAHLWQMLGLGSLAYVFTLAFLIWAMLAPLRPRNWSYRNVLLFLTLTSPPALLYAIPVEKLMSREVAVTANVFFLAVVSAWRVALYVTFLHRTGNLNAGGVIVGTLLPLSIIVFVLAVLNLEHVLFNIMSGIRPEDLSQNDGAYQVVLMLAFFSFFLAPILILVYLVLVVMAIRSKSRLQR